MNRKFVLGLMIVATFAAAMGYSTAAWAAGCCGFCG